MKPGDIHWVDLPTTPGHEQAGRRPAIILQDDAYAIRSPLVITVPLTTAPAASRFPGTLVIEPTPENGLHLASLALVLQIRAVDRRIVRERIGHVTRTQLESVHTALDQLLGRARPLR